MQSTNLSVFVIVIPSQIGIDPGGDLNRPMKLCILRLFLLEGLLQGRSAIRGRSGRTSAEARFSAFRVAQLDTLARVLVVLRIISLIGTAAASYIHRTSVASSATD